MEFKRLHPGFQLPTKGSSSAGGFDLYMPVAGRIHRGELGYTHAMVGLGFSAKVPEGHVAVILPRSSAGVKAGVNLRNTAGVIDSDYTGEWMAALTQDAGEEVNWNEGDRLLQFLVLPVADVKPVEVDELPTTERGDGGFGSTGGTVDKPAKTKAEKEAPTSAPTQEAEDKPTQEASE